MAASTTSSSTSDAAASERRSPIVELSARQLDDALRGVLPNAALQGHSLAKAGRSNTNYLLDTTEGKFVLRVHVRDDALASKERALYEHCRRLVPLARLVGCDTEGVSVGHAFSLLELMSGDSLETVMAAGSSERLDGAICNLGHALAQLTTCRFDTHGDLVASSHGQLTVRPWPFDDFERWALFESPAGVRLGSLRDELWDFLQRAQQRYPQNLPPHIVHGDFNPSNILVAPDGEITAILDWEFAHSGNLWGDVGNLLRYRGVALPHSVKPQLLEGLRDGGFTPPKDWYTRSLLADLSSALEFLSSADDKLQTHARAISQIRGTLTALRE